MHAHDYSLEYRPPILPQRSGPLRALSLCITSCFCVVGALTLLGVAAEPAARHGQMLAQNMRNVVGDAIAHANEAAEARRRMQVAAKQEYLQRRGLATERQLEAEPRQAARRTRLPSLLLRLAAIRKTETATLDDNLVAQFFPKWKTEAGWNENEVLKDLILAVSHLARISDESEEIRLSQ